MNKRKKQAISTLAISTPFFGYGTHSFGIGEGEGAMAVVIAIAVTLGGVGIIAGGTMLFTKNRLGWFDDDLLLETIFKKEKKEMTKIKKEEPVVITGSASQSIELMKREKELETRRKELESLLTEVTKEEQAVEKELKNKGWVLSENGWVIG